MAKIGTFRFGGFLVCVCARLVGINRRLGVQKVFLRNLPGLDHDFVQNVDFRVFSVKCVFLRDLGVYIAEMRILCVFVDI